MDDRDRLGAVFLHSDGDAVLRVSDEHVVVLCEQGERGYARCALSIGSVGEFLSRGRLLGWDGWESVDDV